MRRFKDYLIEYFASSEREGSYPDAHYRENGAQVWIYDSPTLYWYNPKKHTIMRNSKIFVTSKEMLDDITPDNIDAEMDFWKTGRGTHWDLVKQLRGRGKKMAWHFDPTDPFLIHGRSHRGNHQAWKVDLNDERKQRRFDLMWEKAKDAAYKYIK
jgi:hypothetical protein